MDQCERCGGEKSDVCGRGNARRGVEHKVKASGSSAYGPTFSFEVERVNQEDQH